MLEVLWEDKSVPKAEALEEHPVDLWQRWARSKLVPFGVKLPTGSGEVHQVKLRLRLEDGRGTWLVDDFTIDPFRRG